MPHIATTALVALLLALSACSAGPRDAAQRVTAAEPPSTYVYLASGDTRNAKEINVNINFEQMTDSNPDGRLVLMFGLLFGGAVSDAVPVKTEIAGDGLNAGDPIRFTSAAVDAQMKTINNYLLARFPDRDNLVGHLFRGPEGQYVVRTEFDTNAGSNSLYFDVTDWARAKSALYQN